MCAERLAGPGGAGRKAWPAAADGALRTRPRPGLRQGAVAGFWAVLLVLAWTTAAAAGARAPGHTPAADRPAADLTSALGCATSAEQMPPHCLDASRPACTPAMLAASDGVAAVVGGRSMAVASSTSPAAARLPGHPLAHPAADAGAAASGSIGVGPGATARSPAAVAPFGPPAVTVLQAGLQLPWPSSGDGTSRLGDLLSASLPAERAAEALVSLLPVAALLLASSMATALVALMVAHLVLRGRARRAALLAASQPTAAEDAVLLFEGEALVEASDGGRALVQALPAGEGPWSRFSAWAEERFPGFSDRIARLTGGGALDLTAAPPLRLRLTARWCHGMIRVALHDPEAEGRTIPVDRLSLAAAEAELAHLRRMLDAAPLPVWRESDDGTVVWANPAYMRLACEGDGRAEALRWPLPRLFDLAPPAEAPLGPQRVGLDDEGPLGRRWFDCSTLLGAEGQTICYALPADAAVRAEAALKDVVQTLSRTFAHLPVGLAVFDSQRRLQIFNPALGDLTTLPVEFLVSRPGFEAFFDALRSRKMIPEPRDYRAWRKGLTEIERAAASGHYQEVWSLSGGQTYRVTGRPHPDGAVAFLIEDVSAEVSLTRRFRAELETGQAVIDTMPEALAVFSPVGVLVMSNTAYADLWGLAPDTLVGEIGVAEALGVWKAACHPGPHWAQLRTLIGAGGPRRPWEGAIQLRDGRHMLCRLVPLQGGSTLVAFRPATEGALPARPAGPPPGTAESVDAPLRANGGP